MFINHASRCSLSITISESWFRERQCFTNRFSFSPNNIYTDNNKHGMKIELKYREFLQEQTISLVGVVTLLLFASLLLLREQTLNLLWSTNELLCWFLSSLLKLEVSSLKSWLVRKSSYRYWKTVEKLTRRPKVRPKLYPRIFILEHAFTIQSQSVLHNSRVAALGASAPNSISGHKILFIILCSTPLSKLGLT